MLPCFLELAVEGLLVSSSLFLLWCVCVAVGASLTAFLNGSISFFSLTSVSNIKISLLFLSFRTSLFILFSLFSCRIYRSLARILSLVLLSWLCNSLTILRYSANSSNRHFWYSLNSSYFFMSVLFKFYCLCSSFSIFSYIFTDY